MKTFPLVLNVGIICATIGTSAAETTPFDQSDDQAVELGIGADQLSNNYSDWQLGYLLYEQRTERGHLFYTRYQHTERFSQRDNEWLVGAYLALDSDWLAQLEVGTSPTHNVRPELFGNAWLSRKLNEGYIASVGAHHSRWSTVNVSTSSQGYSARLERYVGNWRWSYTARFDQLQGASESGLSHTATLSYYYDTVRAREPSNITFAVNSGEELEKVSPLNVVVTDVQGISLYGLHNTTKHWAWRWALTWQEQGDFYDRSGVTLGVRYRF